MILNETVAAIADAIREKTGKSELIKPVDFASEIKGITAGGSGESGDEWVYYDLRNQESKGIFAVIAQYLPHSVAAILENADPKLFWGTQYMDYNQNNPSNVGLSNILGFGYLVSHKLKVGDNEITGREFITLLTQQTGSADILESTPKITKEEFYALTK